MLNYNVISIFVVLYHTGILSTVSEHESMNIAFIHNRFPAGGAERITADIAGYLAPLGNYKIFVYASHIGKASSDTFRDILTIRKLPTQAIQALRSAKVEEYIKKDRIDIVVQVVKSLPGIEGIKERTGCKTVLANHGELFWQRYGIMQRRLENGRLRNLIYRKKYGDGTLALKMAKERTMADYLTSDAYTVLCRGYKERMERELGIDPTSSRIRYIENPEKVVEHPVLQKEKMLLFVGRFENWSKRIDRLLRIWASIQNEEQMKDWRLELVGDGPDRQMLEELASRLKLERIKFNGFRSDVDKFYDKAWAVCLTSETEGWPLALTEGMARGCIGIAFGCSDGVKEILGPWGECGFAVEPFDEQAYASALLSLTALDEERTQEMRLAGIRRRKRYVPDAICPKWKTLFDELYNSKYGNKNVQS